MSMFVQLFPKNYHPLSVLLLDIINNLNPTMLSQLGSDSLLEIIENFEYTKSFFENVSNILKRAGGKLILNNIYILRGKLYK